jgi:glucose-1-phosphate cytidylyltransferase
MKAVILAGGFGTRISEESHLKPKPMIEIGGQPILWHIMKMYSHYGVNEFVVCLGYKGYVIKEFFNDYYLHMSDLTYDLARNAMRVHKNTSEDWTVTLIDTGLETMTGGRIKRIKEFVGNDDFFLTYGDGVSDININALKEFHKSHGKIATITMVNVPQRFGVINMTDAGEITQFREKSDEDAHRINGGFMVLSPKVFDYIVDGDATVFEREPLENLAIDGQLMAYRHEGFWQCMDTQRDKQLLEKLLEEGNAPWKKWD